MVLKIVITYCELLFQRLFEWGMEDHENLVRMVSGPAEIRKGHHPISNQMR